MLPLYSMDADFRPISISLLLLTLSDIILNSSKQRKNISLNLLSSQSLYKVLYMPYKNFYYDDLHGHEIHEVLLFPFAKVQRNDVEQAHEEAVSFDSVWAGKWGNDNAICWDDNVVESGSCTIKHMLEIALWSRN